MTLSGWLMIAGATAAAVLLGVAWWRRRRQPTAEELEKARRLNVNRVGRLTDGMLMEPPYKDSLSGVTGLVFYRYSASGVEYTAAQDIAHLTDLAPPEKVRAGAIASVKYDPRKPSNSIIICEEWSGLGRSLRAGRPGGETLTLRPTKSGEDLDATSETQGGR